MSRLVKTVAVPNEVRDLVQKVYLEYYQKERVLKGLIDDHQYDENPAEFLESDIFKSYEMKTTKALIEYETAFDEMKNTYLPEEFKGISDYRYNLDFNTSTLTYTKA